MLKYELTTAWSSGFYADLSRSGGALFDLHIHDVDFALRLFGAPDEVLATGDLLHVTGLFRYAEGPGHVSAEGAWDQAPGTPFRMRYVVNFENATADYDIGREDPLLLCREGEAEAVALAPHTGYDGEVRHFLAAVRGEVPLAVRLEEAARGVEMIASWDPKLRAERPGPVRAYPVLMRTPAAVFREHSALREEFFGPVAVAVVCASTTDMLRALAMVQGSLTGTIWAEPGDEADTRRVHTMMEHRVGRLIYNGVPTGVRVAPAMVHGGPYPASNRPDSSAQGPTAIRRLCRPVCFLETPVHLLPPALQAGNPLKIERLVNGKASREPTPTK